MADRPASSDSNPRLKGAASPPNPVVNQEGIDRLLASVESQAQEQAQQSVGGVTAPTSSPVGQDDIDKLLAELGAVPAKPSTQRTAKPTTMRTRHATTRRTPGTGSDPVLAATDALPPSAAGANIPRPSLALSPADLDALVSKQATGADLEQGPQAMLDQKDIDALVKQMATATGSPEDTKRISAVLAKHHDDIDRLFDQAEPAGRGPAGRAPAGVPTFVPGAPVLAAGEMRGTRWLLAVAVVFLAAGVAVLVAVTGSLRTLSQELRQTRTAQAAPADNYGDELKAALTTLASDDEAEQAKGVVFLQRLRSRHPAHEAEVTLLLARHYRAHGAHRSAVAEFAGLVDGAAGPLDDPLAYLDYADCLARLDDLPGALRAVHVLLANADTYLANADRHGLARSADASARNRRTLQEAHLALGRLLFRTWERHQPAAGPPGPQAAARPAGPGSTEGRP